MGYLDRVLRLFGETLREMGLLIAVFAPLDALFGGMVNVEVVVTVAIGGLLLAGCGILIVAREVMPWITSHAG